MTTIDKAAEVAAYWGTCEGCGASKARCDEWTTLHGIIKCCPDCNHVTALEPRAEVPCVCNVGVQECPVHPARLRTQEEKIEFRKEFDRRVEEGWKRNG